MKIFSITYEHQLNSTNTIYLKIHIKGESYNITNIKINILAVKKKTDTATIASYDMISSINFEN